LRNIGRAEGHRLVLDLLNASTRADRLIVEADAGVFLILIGPFGEDRVGEGRASTGDIRRLGARAHSDDRSGQKRRARKIPEVHRTPHVELECRDWIVRELSGRLRSSSVPTVPRFL